MVDSRTSGNAGIFMVVDPDSRSQKILAVEYLAGCDTAGAAWCSGLGLATGGRKSSFRTCGMAVDHLSALKAIRTIITTAGKRTSDEQTNAENQYQWYAQGFIGKHFMYVWF